MASMAVFAVENGRARLVRVRVGARNGSEAWLKSGVAPGTQVVVYPPTTVREGAALAVRKV